MFIIRVIDKLSSAEACFSRNDPATICYILNELIQTANFTFQRVILETVAFPE